MDEELDKEGKVRTVHQDSGEDDVAMDTASRSKVDLVDGHAEDGNPADHLDDLEGGDAHGNGFGDFDPDRLQGKVRVHDGVDKVVHDDEVFPGR